MELAEMSEMNEIKDEFLYAGFVDQDLENETGIGTYDFGETLVMLSPVGNYMGCGVDGNPVEEVIDDVAIGNVVYSWKCCPDELLLDIDHKSMRVPEDRDTTAAGWIYDLVQIKELGKLNGLYGRVKWTSIGRELIESRQYRFISPVFELDGEGRPTRLVNAGLTNRPALSDISPILNSEPNKEEIEMTKEEVIELIKNTISSLNKENTEEKEQETKVNVENECKNECPDEPVVDTPVENTEVVDTPVENTEDTPVETPEVIKEEVLNSTPTIGSDISTKGWESLKGQALFDWCNKHRDEI